MDISHKENHFQKIRNLQKHIKNSSQGSVLRNRDASNTLRNGAYKRGHQELDLSLFNQVIDFSKEEQWILVEPKMSFEELCHFTLLHDLIPPVVPEFKTITIGGAIIGASLESSSHRWGQVNDTALEYELILGNGELLQASPSLHSDLFFALPGSYGTLAILTAVKLKLIEAKKWVVIHSREFSDVNNVIENLIEPTESDFIEGIIYQPSQSFIIKGYMTDEKKGSICRFNKAWSPWYVQHIQQTRNREESIPLKEYLFRFDRGAFWMGRYIHSFWTIIRLLAHLGIPKIDKHSLHPNSLFRFFFGWAFASQRLYKMWHHVPNKVTENLFFIHDFYTPFSQAAEALRYFMQKTNIFPIWLCPIKKAAQPQILSPHHGNQDFLNIGLYGVPESQLSISMLTAKLEQDILTFGGKKMLYSFSYYDKETFSRIYQMPYYNDLRKKYHAENAFPSLYTKVTHK